MPLLSCPSPELLLTYISIPAEMGLFRRVLTKAHIMRCPHCQEQAATMRASWNAYFSPEPDITGSLMRVYSRLQKDETLILSGWKLGEFRSHRDLSGWLFQGGWLFRGGVSLGIGALLTLLIVSQMRTEDPNARMAHTSVITPLAQIRFEDEKQTKVHYVRPELLQSIEFETTSGR